MDDCKRWLAGSSAGNDQLSEMTGYIHTEADLKSALRKLSKAEPRFAELLKAAGLPPLRRREAGFAGLIQIIIGQQVSTASAAAIWGRLFASFEPFDPQTLRRARTDRLARIGLSAPKIKTVKAIASAITAGELDLAALGELPADDAHAILTAVHGIGPWTADIYLLTCLGHADAWPAGDLALQEAARLAFTLPARPTSKEMIPLAENWRPWRAVAARQLWTYYAFSKRREYIPI
jgi:DNA-3-methyladenine glycosylase II